MNTRLNSFLAIGASVVIGGVVGVCARTSELVDGCGRSGVAGDGLGSGLGLGAAGQEGAAKKAVAVPNISEEAGFCGWSVERQKEMLLRLHKKYGAIYPSNVQLMLARMVAGLSGDQLSGLLEVLPNGGAEDAITRRFLMESLATADPQRAIELGRKLKEESLVGIAIATVAQKSGVEALGLLEGMKEAELGRVLRGMTSPLWPSHFNGTVSEVGDFLQANSKLAEEVGVQGFGKLLGKVVAQNPADSGGAIAQVRALAAEVAGRGKPEGEKQGSVDGFLKGVTDTAYRGLVGQSPESGAAFLESVPETQKSPWLLQLEAVSRFRTQGLESAIQLAEKQGGDEFVKMAATGTWVALAQQDRAGALSWVETLPEGPFRRGAYMGVLMDAFRYGGNEAGLQHAIDAPAELSAQSKVGYYDELIQLSRQWGSMWGAPTPGQIIERTPLTTELKDELYRRAASIKAKY